MWRGGFGLEKLRSMGRTEGEAYSTVKQRDLNERERGPLGALRKE